MTTLNINFLSENATIEMKNEFFTAVKHEETSMLISVCNDKIARLEKDLKKDDITEEEVKALKSKLTAEKQVLETLNTSLSETKDIYNKVIADMTKKNENHFGNKLEVVRNVLRVLATWDNKSLIKYALVETFEGEALHDALETIHINSKPNDDGCLVLTKEVKEAYKKASNELESIIKNTFSLSFPTSYTDKTRVKMNADDKKLLNDCYVKDVDNNMSKNEATGVVDFAGRMVKTLVKSKKNKRTGKVTYDYSGLYQVITKIVMKHYFK